MTDNNNMTPEQILDAAADYIHEHGWCRGTLIDDEGRVCLQGALTKGCPGVGRVDVALRAVAKALPTGIARRSWGSRIPFWNDNVCRDADEAIHMLKKAKEFL